MDVIFNQFRFQPEQQVLTEDGTVVPLNEKAVKLLAMLLEHPDKIHSKQDILDTVWNDRVVSDQVVFQNISQLRAILGNLAIKTYPKKGYQWQLPLSSADSTTETLRSDQSRNTEFVNEASEPSTASKSKRQRSLKLAGTGIFVTLLIALFVWLLFVTPYDSEDLNRVELIHIDNQGIQSGISLESLDAKTVFNSPYASWQQQAQSPDQWLVSKALYQLSNGYGLRFHVQGSERGWSDYLYASNASEVNVKFNELIGKLAETDFFNIKQQNAAVAELTVLQNRYPNDALIGRALAVQYLASYEFDKAIGLINLLLDKSNDELYDAQLLLLRSKVHAELRDLDSAKQDAENALAIFNTLGLPQLEADSLHVISWYHMEQLSFLPGIQILNQAVNKARVSGEKRLELELLLAQATMSWKNDQTQMALSLVDLAKQIIELHSLPPIHHTPIHSVEARFSSDQNEKLQSYLASLDLPFSPTYSSQYYTAARMTRNIYIEQGNWQSALDAAREWQRPSFVSLSQAKVYLAQQNWQQGLAMTQRAFEQAKLDHQRIDALDSALLLVINAERLQESTESYRQFIEREATPRWRYQNREALKSISL